MCEGCTQLAALEVDAELLALEADVIALEAAAGWNVPGASRPLFAHEVTAKTRFGVIDRAGKDTADAAARIATDLRGALFEALANDLDVYTGDPAGLVARLTALASPSNTAALPGVNAQISAAARQITAALEAGRQAAVAEMLSEATRQGVHPDTLPGPDYTAPTPQEATLTKAAAREIAEAPMNRLVDAALKAAKKAAVPGAEGWDVYGDAVDAAQGVNDAHTNDLARQAATKATANGRGAVAVLGPDVKQVYASELMDRNTCFQCSYVDGRTYQSMADALVDYPGAGGFTACAGGARCRGTLVVVWATEADPTNTDGPDLTPRGPASNAPTGMPPMPDPATLTPGDLEAGLAAALAGGTEAEQLAYAAELDARANAPEMTPELERATVDESWWTAPKPEDEGYAEHVASMARAEQDAADGFTQEAGAVADAMRGGAMKGATRAEKDAALKARYTEYNELHSIEAETQTNGYLIRHDRREEFDRKFGTGASTAELFRGRLATGYRYASPELLEFWESHPRLTYYEWLVQAGASSDSKVHRGALAAREARDGHALKAGESPAKQAERKRAADRDKRRKAGPMTPGQKLAKDQARIAKIRKQAAAQEVAP